MAQTTNVGHMSAWSLARSRGYTGTREEYAELMASYATVAQQAAESAGNASQSATNASQSAQNAETAKGTAQQAATDAQTAQASAQESAQSAQQSAQSASQSAQSAESAKETAVDAVDGFAAGAQQALDDVNQAGNNWKSLAQAKALDSEAYALGTRDGEDVGSSDPAYHNNAKYYAESVGSSAQTASEAAQTATQKAGEAQASASAAAESARTLTIDATLTQSGQAADAKKTGDEITDLKANLNVITDTNFIQSSNLFDIANASSGYYWANGHNETSSYNNTGYVEVEEGKTITFQYGKKQVGNLRATASMRFIAAYDSDKNYLSSASQTSKMSYTVPTGVKYLIISVSDGYFKIDGSNNCAVVYGTDIIAYEDYFEPYTKTTIKESVLPIPTLHVYLPSEIPVGIGRTIELYNELVCLEAEKYHLHYSCNVGVQYKRKFSITGSTAGTYTLTLDIYDDHTEKIWSGTSKVKVASNSIGTAKKVLPIGDSITNLKPWLSEVQTLSESKIQYIGTRGRVGGTIRHEGRSGFNALEYNEDTSYTFDENYVGASDVSGSVNPFWNGTRFSLAYYNTKQAGTVGTADAVQLFLGTNDVFGNYTPEESAQHIKTLVDNIRLDDANIPIFVCNTIYRSNQSGYYSSGGQGFTAASGWAFDSDMKIMNFQNALAEALQGYTNVYIVPLSVCMDRENDFGRVEVAVNPRLDTVTEYIPSESVHPQNAGYMQIADVMYSSYIAHLT